MSGEAEDIFADLAKAILKEIAFQRELADGFQHLIVLSLQGVLLSPSGFVLSF